MNLYGIVLAGGSGSRLWPLSREMYPKQLLKLNGDKTLFQSTFLRLSKTLPAENIITVTNIKHKTDIKLQLSELKDYLRKQNDFEIITEPVGRNTAPAIALSVFYILNALKDETDPIIAVAPSDHLIQSEEKFRKALEEGVKLAQNGYIVTFGIQPDKPDTGYGYIKTVSDKEIKDISACALKAEKFKEKPTQEVAQEYFNDDTFFWNSGIFIFRASVFLRELEIYSNEIFKELKGISFDREASPTLKFEDYSRLPDLSVDYAVMEHSKKIALIPVDCGWNDMGSWQAIYDTADKDVQNNFISGNVIDIESENSLIYSTSKLVTTIGLKDTVIIETDDAVLACDKNRTQDVKKIFEQLKCNNDNACKIHSTVYRPWGYYTVLNRGEGYLIKIIEVNPQAKLSIQMHYHRSEHWLVLAGIARVIKDEEEVFLNPGDSIDIPTAVKHSLQNPGKIELKIIEIQRGSYLEEDDIVRFEDIYGRVSI